MKNKQKLLIGAIAVISILIFILGVYFFNKNKKESGFENNFSSDNFTERAESQEVIRYINTNNFTERADPYEIIGSMDKEKCSLSNERDSQLCLNGIELIGKAIAANNTQGCFDKSISVDTRIRVMCLQGFSGIKNIGPNSRRIISNESE